MNKRVFDFLLSVFSEVDGSGSASRFLAGTTVLATLFWITYVVIRTHVIPDLTAPALFISSAFTGYAVNKTTGVFTKKPDPPKVS
jgi:hypothetical protein